MRYVVEESSLVAIADAIRAKTGESASLTLAEMATEIAGIETGGGSSGGTSSEKTKLAEAFEGTITVITAEDLQGCSGLEPGVVEGYAGYYNLTAITIPETVTYVMDYAFANLPYLETITFLSETPPTIDSFFIDVICGSLTDSGTVTIYVPASAVDTYKSATNWSEYADKIQAIP